MANGQNDRLGGSSVEELLLVIFCWNLNNNRLKNCIFFKITTRQNLIAI